MRSIGSVIGEVGFEFQEIWETKKINTHVSKVKPMTGWM